VARGARRGQRARRAGGQVDGAVAAAHRGAARRREKENEGGHSKAGAGQEARKIVVGGGSLARWAREWERSGCGLVYMAPEWVQTLRGTVDGKKGRGNVDEGREEGEKAVVQTCPPESL